MFLVFSIHASVLYRYESVNAQKRWNLEGWKILHVEREKVSDKASTQLDC